MANRRLALETSAHTSSAKSSPTVKPDVDDVGEDRTFAGSVTAPPRCPVDILAPSRPSLDSPPRSPAPLTIPISVAAGSILLLAQPERLGIIPDSLCYIPCSILRLHLHNTSRLWPLGTTSSTATLFTPTPHYWRISMGFS